MKWVIYCLFFICLFGAVQGATIHGTVYDLDLAKAVAIVEINTQPNQQMVSVNGEYSFDVAPGEYVLTAKQLEYNITIATAEENISFIDERDYVLDLILFPEFEIEFDDIGSDLDELDIEEKDNLMYYILPALILLLIVVLMFVHKVRKVEKEMMAAEISSVEEQILVLLKKNEGRLTQKDIRKEIPLSEAKISLVIADLESQGKVKKIKKGRGNIISLTR